MVVRILPDRERRHLLQFYAVPRASYGLRLSIAAVAIITGLAIQLLAASSSLFGLVAGASLLLVGNAFLLVRGYNLRPGFRVQGPPPVPRASIPFRVPDAPKTISR